MKTEQQEKPTSPRHAEISVILAAPQLSPTLLENCLTHIFANNLEDAEIIAATGAPKKDFANLVAKFPKVCFLPIAPKEATLPVLLAAGLAEATGEIIAITDTSCVVADNWVSAILTAHRAASEAKVIGGAVELRGQKNLVEWAAYFCDYSLFMPPFESGTAKAVPGNNITFKCETLADSGEFTTNGFWKTLWCQKLLEQGIELNLDPSIMVYLTKTDNLLPFLKRRFQHGRCFAGMRCRQLTWPKRAFFVFGSIGLPFIFMSRIIAPVLAKKRFLKQLFFASPIITLAVVLWSLGETCGYLAGAGKSCETIR